MKSEYIERLAEVVHKAYCEQYKKKHGKEYWTKGDYNKLDEITKDYDRATVQAVIITQESLKAKTRADAEDIDSDYEQAQADR